MQVEQAFERIAAENRRKRQWLKENNKSTDGYCLKDWWVWRRARDAYQRRDFDAVLYCARLI